MTLPRPSLSATFPRNVEQSADAREASPPEHDERADARETTKPTQLARRGLSFVKSHWKQIGLVALGLVGWRSRRLRPLVRKAAMMYAVPMAKKAFAFARR